MSTNVAFFETTLFSLSSTVTSLGEDDDLLVYYVSIPVPTLATIPIQPPITQVYSQCQNPPVSCPTLAALTLDPVSSDDLPILSIKVNVSVLTQSLLLFPIIICHLPLVPLLHLLILSLFLTLSVRLYLTLVGIVPWWMKCRL